MSKKSKIAIIGGGISGLLTAYLINQRLPNAKITIFEASEECGGSLNTERFSDGTYYEAGIPQFHESLEGNSNNSEYQDPLRALIEDDLELDTVNIDGGAYILDDEILRESDEEEDTQNRINNFHKKTSYPKSSAQAYHVSDGLEKVVDSLLDEIDADIRLCSRVVEVCKKDDNSYEVCLIETDDETIAENSEDFNAIIVALSSISLKGIVWQDKLDTVISEIHETCCDITHLVRVSILFDNKWWKKHKLPGEFWMMDLLGCCICYDESTRWARKTRKRRRARIRGGKRKKDRDEREDGESEEENHCLSFLIHGCGAMMLCASDQDDDCIVDYVMQSLPPLMREDAEEHFVEGCVNRYIECKCENPTDLHSKQVPDQQEHPGVFLVGDYFHNEGVSGTLKSAGTAVKALLKYLEETGETGTESTQIVTTQ